MPEYKVVEDPTRAAERGQLTFTIDGHPTMRWFKKCGVEGLPEDYYVQRCISRLRQGRSDIFGGPMVMAGTKVVKQLGNTPIRATITKGKSVPAKTTSRSGKTVEKQKESWTYTLDGEESKETFPSERAAKEAACCKAWITSGKLGRLKEVQEALDACGGGKVEVCSKTHKITATGNDGKEYVVGFGETITLKAK